MGWNFGLKCEDLHEADDLKQHLIARCSLIGDLWFPDYSLFSIEVSHAGFIPNAHSPEGRRQYLDYLAFVPATFISGNMSKEIDFRPSLWSLAVAFMEYSAGDVVAADQIYDFFLVRRQGVIYASQHFKSVSATSNLPNVHWIERPKLSTPASLSVPS